MKDLLKIAAAVAGLVLVHLDALNRKRGKY